MSQSSSLPALPSGSIRAGFEAARRSHAAARQGLDDASLPAARQIADPATPVEAAIAAAAAATNVDFGFLLAQAEVESAMNPAARAAASSATGLYQFIEGTWLETVKRHGARFGLGGLADQIARTASGAAEVADPAQRRAILALRSDPRIAALMAAGLAEDNAAHLAPILGRQPDHAELYLAHFLGSHGAGRFLSELQADPGQSAAALFARPAAANRAIFYAADGSPRSLAEVMAVIGGKLERALAGAGGEAIGGGGRRLARADHAAPSSVTPAPLIAADADVFGPGLASAPTLASLPVPAARSVRRAAMSQVLEGTFGRDPAAAPPQVRRAYDRLRALGL